MGMVLTEEQTLLRDSARDFIQGTAPITEFRKLRDEGNTDRLSRDLWAQMVEMGWAGILIPEEYGGLDFGFQGLGLIMEEAGKTLTASPLLSTIVLGGSAVLLGGTANQKTEILPKIAAGELLTALAVDEGPHHRPENIALSAKASGDKFVLTGTKKFVADGHVADLLIVAARTSGASGSLDGLTLFLVDPKSAGVSIDPLHMVDHRSAAHITLNDVEVNADNVLGGVDAGGNLLTQVLDRGRIALAAEMLGSMSQVFDITLEYLKERKQFGQLIGSFQSLQHRAAQMFSEIELSKSVVLEALTAVDESADNVAELASLAKAYVNDTFNLVSREGVQMHGGIGMTDEHNVGLFIKRARVVEQSLGSAQYHRDRYATLCGY